MASTGSSLDADIAGTIPDTIPMTTETLNPKAIFSKVRSTENSRNMLTS